MHTRLQSFIEENLRETATTGEKAQDKTLQLHYSVGVISEEFNGPAPEGTQKNKIQDEKGVLSANPNTLFVPYKEAEDSLSQEQREDSLGSLDVEFYNFINKLESEKRKRDKYFAVEQQNKRSKSTRFDI